MNPLCRVPGENDSQGSRRRFVKHLFTYSTLSVVTSVPFGLLVWSTGLAPNPVVEAVTDVKKDPKTSRYNYDSTITRLPYLLTPSQPYHRREPECHNGE